MKKKYKRKNRETHNIEIFPLSLQSVPVGQAPELQVRCQSASLVVSDPSLLVSRVFGAAVTPRTRLARGGSGPSPRRAAPHGPGRSTALPGWSPPSGPS